MFVILRSLARVDVTDAGNVGPFFCDDVDLQRIGGQNESRVLDADRILRVVDIKRHLRGLEVGANPIAVPRYGQAGAELQRALFAAARLHYDYHLMRAVVDEIHRFGRVGERKSWVYSFR